MRARPAGGCSGLGDPPDGAPFEELEIVLDGKALMEGRQDRWTASEEQDHLKLEMETERRGGRPGNPRRRESSNVG